ncbi:MAG: hypothetical protein ACI8P0_001591 [Planctomycetaceae bacterium]|jgi:hypothetical protein
MTTPRIIGNGSMIFFQTGPDDSEACFFDSFDVPDFFGRLRAGAGAGSGLDQLLARLGCRGVVYTVGVVMSRARGPEQCVGAQLG